MNCFSNNLVRNVHFIKNNHAVQGIVALRRVHTTTVTPNYADAQTLPIPQNIDAAETTRFSPQRSRDISATVILSQYGQPMSAMTPIDITADNTMTGNGSSTQQDPHVQSYDCFGAVSLNSVMQSNVPSPFGGMHKFTHLNMPGGQWSQDYKFMSQNLHASHYTTLREEARSGWVSYDQDATISSKDHHQRMPQLTAISRLSNVCTITRRAYCTAKKPDESEVKNLTKKEQLKRAFKDYGSTVIIFHVTISLLSLAGCYALVSGGLDPVPLLKFFGLEDRPAITNRVVTGGSTFVVAYAIHKVFAPLRISVTLGATPFIVRYLRSKGILKINNNKKK